jgi:hypothetical protein
MLHSSDLTCSFASALPAAAALCFSCHLQSFAVLSQRDTHSGEEQTEVAFEFRKLRFNYHTESNGFERLRFPVHEPFSYYLKASGYGHGDKVAAAAAQWGLNKFEVSCLQ